jgi:hypothetical protein
VSCSSQTATHSISSHQKSGVQRENVDIDYDLSSKTKKTQWEKLKLVKEKGL